MTKIISAIEVISLPKDRYAEVKGFAEKWLKLFTSEETTPYQLEDASFARECEALGFVMADGTFVSWLAIDDDKIIGTSGMSFVEKPPYFSCPTGKLGLLSSMYTDSGYRRMGIAKELLHRVVEEARFYGCGAVQITASDMGVKLYTAYGFKHKGNIMQYIF